jgi:hypothetical protein
MAWVSSERVRVIAPVSLTWPWELSQKSAGFRQSLCPTLGASLAHLLRAMNCYYNNLIEGHDTHPIDIERALSAD